MPIAADLVVSRVVVTSFRCIERAVLTLDTGTTVLVGENNAGKTSLLLAIHTALGRRRPVADDLRRDSQGQRAGSATIDVVLSPASGEQTFSDDVRQRLVSVQREPGTNQEVVAFRTTLRPSDEGALLVTTNRFLQPLGAEWVESPTPPFQARVLELIEAHLLDASRDLVAEMATQTSAWGRLLSDLRIPDYPAGDDGLPDRRSRPALEQQLRVVSETLREASPVLTQLDSDLADMAKSHATLGEIKVLPLPLRVEEIARGVEVVVERAGSPALALRFQGSGSRSLAALLVFRTMCTLKLGADQGIRPHLVTLLEEPEAHLHPHAIAALIGIFNTLPGQRILSTHSSALVAELPPENIRLIRRTEQGVSVNALSRDRPKDAEHFRRFFGRPFSEVYFARLVVLGDGISERNALPTLTEMAIGADPAGMGITYVDCKSLNDHVNVNRILSVVHELGIPWLCFADNDDAGREGLGRLLDPGTLTPLNDGHPSVVLLTGTKQLEQLLIDAGYGDLITEIASECGGAANDDPTRLRYLARNKPWASEAVVRRARELRRAPPPQLEPLVEAICRVLSVARRPAARVPEVPAPNEEAPEAAGAIVET